MTLSLYENNNITEYSLIKIIDIINNYLVPDFQRSVVCNRVNILSNSVLLKFNPITPLYFCIYENQRYIIDGQHRLECYKLNKNLHNENISIIDIFIKNKEDMNYYFKLINDTMVLNDIWIDENQIKKDIVVNTYEYFTKTYPGSFKLKNKNRPYLNFDKFLTQITEILDTLNEDDLKIKSSEDYIKLLEDLNKKYSEKENNWFPSKGSTKNDNIILTLKKNKCLYFGMLPNDWPNHLIRFPEINNEINTQSQAFRSQVWFKYCNGQVAMKCLCCDINTISSFNFE